MELKKSHIENLYRNLLENGRVKTKGGLHVKTVTNIANMLHESLQEAMRDEYIIKNPAALARVPTMRSENCAKSKIEVLTAEERKILEDNCGNDIYGTAIYMLLNTGVRIGELLGIQWRDIDFNKGAVSINKQVNRIKNYDSAIAAKTRLLIQHSTKTNKSTRIIPLHEELLKRLSIYKKIQDEQKILWGDMYNDSDMVFCNECGNLIDPSTIRSHFHKKLAALGVNKIKLHALRHTFATEALEAGVPLKAVSKILGHSSSQITADTYSHVSLELQQEAMSQIQRYKDSRNSL